MNIIDVTEPIRIEERTFLRVRLYPKLIGAFLSIFILAPYTPGVCQEWHEGLGEVTLANITPEAARQKAFEKARVDALAKARLEVTGVTSRQQSDDGGGSQYDNFINFTITKTQGLIIEVDTLIDEPVMLSMSDGTRVLSHQAKIRAKIKLEQGEPDPGFDLDMKLNQEAFMVGDELIVQLKATRDCYITILNLYSNDSLSVIFPNQYARDNHLLVGDTMSIPPEDAFWSFPVNLVSGKSLDHEVLLAVATKDNVSFRVNDAIVRDGVLAQSDALLAVNRWFAGIDSDRRSEAWVFYKIIR